MPLSRMMMESSPTNTMGKEMAVRHHLLPLPGPPRRTAHNLSSSSLRKCSDASLLHKVPCAALRPLLANLNEVLLTTRLFLLFPAVLLAIAATYLHLGQDGRTVFTIRICSKQAEAEDGYMHGSWMESVCCYSCRSTVLLHAQEKSSRTGPS